MKMSLDTMLEGAVLELFNIELQKVATNICDPNTAAKSKRQIRITFEIKPNDERDLGTIAVAVESRLCAPNAAYGRLSIGYNSTTKDGEMSEYRASQLSIPFEPDETDDKVIDLRKI